MTASSPRGCATAAASPPRRSIAFAPSWRSTGRRRLRAPPSSCASRARPAALLPLRRRRQPRRPLRRRTRSAAQFPLLRQPAEVSPLRQHLQRKVGGREPGRARARQCPSAAAGDARLRRRRRRRHRAAAGDARDARSLSAHALLRGRQGDQPRGRPARAAENVGPLLRASRDRAGADQPRLFRRALARGQVAVGGVEPGLAGGSARRQFGLPLRAADHRPRAVPVAELEGRGFAQDRQPGLRPARW